MRRHVNVAADEVQEQLAHEQDSACCRRAAWRQTSSLAANLADMPRAPHSRRQSCTRVASLRKGLPGRIQPSASRAQPAPARRKRPENRRSSAHANRRLPDVRLPRPAPSRADPPRKQPRRAAGTPRRAPYLSRDVRTTRNRRVARAACGPTACSAGTWHHITRCWHLLFTSEPRSCPDVAQAVEALLSADDSWVRSC